MALIMRICLLPDALDPGIECVRTHWIWGFMAVQMIRRARAGTGCQSRQ
jgi:hypothetical protein